jgi:Tol biopolymer transport system component
MFMPYPKWIFTFALLLTISVPSIAQNVTPSPDNVRLPDNLVVAWIESRNLFSRTGEGAPVQLTITGDALIPYLSPDGQHIAYSHGDGDLATELSLVNFSDGKVRDLISSKSLSADTNAPLLISQLRWLDNSSLYFNTIQNTSFGQDRRDDLWRVNIQTGEVFMLLAPGEGGTFSSSPDRQWIAIISAGTYDHDDAHIRLLNAATGSLQEILAFPAVSTGSEYRFYPQVFWETDSHAFRVAIPDKDLIYDEINSSSVVLWSIGIDGSSEKIGSVPASFFGLPSWSGNGQNLIYLRRAGALTDNQFDMLLADGNGDNPVNYVSGEAGSFGFPTWIPNANQFIYALGEPGSYWLGSPDAQPISVAEKMFNPTFLEDGQIVYVSVPINPFELRYTHIGTNQSLLIATVDSQFMGFDAIIAQEN